MTFEPGIFVNKLLTFEPGIIVNMLLTIEPGTNVNRIALGLDSGGLGRILQ